jgi:uncharacterized membrane protein
MAAEDKLSEKDRRQILAAIEAAEKNTSGEIRLFVEDVCGENVLDRAAYVFNKLGMLATKDRNGVLFYLAFESRQFAILGDVGIHSIVKDDFWHDIKARMTNYFTEGDFVKGLTIGIEMTGKALKEHFPFQSDDKNELSNDIAFTVE